MTKAESIMPVDFDRETNSKLGFVKRHRLRPEFVRSYDKRLNPDAFLDLAGSKQNDLSDFELGEAHKSLVTTRFRLLLDELESYNFVPLSSQDLSELFKYYGINTRYLGLATV
jgi:hypothetical protein